MMRFAKPDGSPFNLDYIGPIHVFDDDNERIAICRGSDPANAPYDLPELWDSWVIVMAVQNDPTYNVQRYLQGAIAAAWTATFQAARILCDLRPLDESPPVTETPPPSDDSDDDEDEYPIFYPQSE